MDSINEFLDKYGHDYDFSSMDVDDLKNLIEANGFDLADLIEVDFHSFLTGEYEINDNLHNEFNDLEDFKFSLSSPSKVIADNLKEQTHQFQHLAGIEKAEALIKSINNASTSLFGNSDTPTELEYIGMCLPKLFVIIFPSDPELIEKTLEMTGFNLKNLSNQIANSMPKGAYSPEILDNEKEKQEYDRKLEEVLNSLLNILGVKKS